VAVGTQGTARTVGRYRNLSNIQLDKDIR
jgi:hypothetical protein